MSLWSILNNTTSQTATYGSAQATATMQKLIAAQAKLTTANNATSTNASPTISANAQLAALERTDNAKSFDTVSSQTRAALNAQYAAHSRTREDGALDLSKLSGRALAAVALNQTGAFSAGEITQAKVELRTRSIEAYKNVTSGKSGIAALTSYNSWQIARYDAISPEERMALGWTDQTRAGAVRFLNRDTSLGSES
jgi:hypothetical protein